MTMTISKPSDTKTASIFEASLTAPFSQLPNDVLMAMRDAAKERFTTLGFPVPRKEEAWKYMDIKSLSQFSIDEKSSGDSSALLNMTDSSPWVEANALQYVILPSELEAGGPLRALTDVIVENPERLARLVHAAHQQDDALSCLNMAFADMPLSLALSENEALDAPIEMLIRHDAKQRLFPAIYIDMEAHSSAELFIRIEGNSTKTAHYLQGLIMGRLGEGSKLTINILSNSKCDGFIFLNSEMDIAANAQLHISSIALSADNFRHRMDARLNGEGSDATLNGLSILGGQTRSHQHVRLDHKVPKCTSSQKFKAAVGGEAFSEFDGTIYVRKDAQQTNAQQLSRNLLLSKKAKAFARPWLQIDADDVKCSHGATVGQLSETELFYLSSRGIDDDTAKAMLTEGFCNDQVQAIQTQSDAIRKYIRGRSRCALASMIKG